MHDLLRRLWTGLRRALSAVAPSAARDDVRTIVLVFLVTTAVVWLVAYGASCVIQRSDPQLKDYPETKIRAVWIRWDSKFHRELAWFGYQNREDRLITTPWFPLYGSLMRYLSPRERHHYSTGQWISLVSFFLLLCVLFDVAAQKHGKQVAHLAVFYYSIFPSAMFFRAVYPDALFVLLVLLSYRAFEREKFLRCGIYGALAAMTRLPGILLLPAFAAALVWEVWRRGKPFRPAMLWIGLIAAGLGVVMAIQWRAVGDPLAFLHAAKPGPEGPLFPSATRAIAELKRVFTEWNVRRGLIEFHVLLGYIVLILAVVGAVRLFRRHDVAAGSFALFFVLPAFVFGGAISLVRNVLPVFFYVILLAEIGNQRQWFHTLWIYLSSLLLAFYTVCFACWYWTA